MPCTAPAATQQDGCKAPTARQMQSSSAGSASSASTCWAAAWSSDVPLDAPVSRPGIVLAPPKECITVSARPLQVRLPRLAAALCCVRNAAAASLESWCSAQACKGTSSSQPLHTSVASSSAHSTAGTWPLMWYWELQALDFYIRCLSSPTSHVANFAGKGPALPFAECQDLHTQLKVSKRELQNAHAALCCCAGREQDRLLVPERSCLSENLICRSAKLWRMSAGLCAAVTTVHSRPWGTSSLLCVSLPSCSALRRLPWWWRWQRLSLHKPMVLWPRLWN